MTAHAGDSDDPLLRRSFQAGVNLHVPRPETVRIARGWPLVTVVTQLVIQLESVRAR